MRERLERGFFERDPLVVAPALLGTHLCCVGSDGVLRAGRIVETEAYRGEEDRACHAAKGRTRRTAAMYGPPGRAYIYLIYGMYDMFNAVCWPEGRPSAVLVRALTPLWGLVGKTDGPGKLCRALHIDRRLHEADLRGERLFIAPGEPLSARDIATGPRIGVDYAGEWAQRPWRFFSKHTSEVSRPRRQKKGTPAA